MVLSSLNREIQILYRVLNVYSSKLLFFLLYLVYTCGSCLLLRRKRVVKGSKMRAVELLPGCHPVVKASV